MSTAYIPRADSLADKVCRYFMRLPDEELLTREIAANFEAEVKNVGNNLRLAVEAGYLTVDGTVYSAGRDIGRFIQAINKGEQQAADGAAGTPPPGARRTVPQEPVQGLPDGPFCCRHRQGDSDADGQGAIHGLDAAVRQAGRGRFLPATGRSAFGHRQRGHEIQAGHRTGAQHPHGA